MDFTIKDNSEEIKRALKETTVRALERIGLQAEGYAKDLCPVDTGTLRNSITHKVVNDDNEVYIGTNNEYAAYVELGTGIYVQGGRQDPWYYQDDNGNWHRTRGSKAQPYLKPAVADHKRTYQNIIEDEFRNG